MRLCFLLILSLVLSACSTIRRTSTKIEEETEKKEITSQNVDTVYIYRSDSTVSKSDSSFLNRIDYHLIYDTDKADEHGNAPVREVNLVLFNSGSVNTEWIESFKLRLNSFSKKDKSVYNESTKYEEEREDEKESMWKKWKMCVWTGIIVFILTMLFSYRKKLVNLIYRLLIKLKL